MQALLIDMDGTLIETESRWWVAERIVMENHGSTWDIDDQNMSIGGPMHKVVEYMAAKANSNADQINREIIEAMLENFQKHPAQLLPGWENILNEARELGIKTALVTASYRVLAEALLERNGFVKYFDLVVTADDVKETKPFPEPYLKAADEFGLKSLDCLVFEDSNTGVTSSLAAGMPTIALPERVLLDARRGMKILKSIKGMKIKDLKIIHNELKQEFQEI